MAQKFFTACKVLWVSFSFLSLTSPSFAKSGLGLKTYTDYTHFTELKSTNDTSNINFGLSFFYKKKFNSNLALKIHPHLDWSDLKNHKGENFVLRSENSALYYKDGSFSIGMGLLSHSFGLSQVFSPLNFIDTASYTNPLDPKKISSPSLRFMYKKRGLRLFATYFPKRFTNIYPGQGTSWIPTKAPSNLKVGDETLIFPDEIAYSFKNKIEHENALKNNFTIGARHKTKKLFTQALYYYGVDADPTFDLDLTLNLIDATPNARKLQVDPNIIATPIYQKVQRLGLSLRYTLPIRWRLIYEGNLSRGDSNIRQGYRHSHTHTAGLEWGVPIGKTLLVGVFQTYLSRKSESSSIGLVSPFKEAYLMGAQWDYKGFKPEYAYIKFALLGVSLHRLGLKYSHKSLDLQISYNRLDGKVLEFISGLLERDSLSLKATLSF